jgi:glycine/D-amino acid oxidase-like deaminating enzyme
LQSYWEQDSLSYFDYSIVGGGILGLFTALELRKKYPQSTIAIFEKSMFSQGATSRNAGFVCFGSATEIMSDRLLLGDEKTLEIIQKRWLGIQAIQSKFTDEEIDYKNYGGYELINEESKIDLDELNLFLYPIFNQNVFEYRNESINEFGFQKVKSIIYNKLEGQLHSGKLILALHRQIQSNNIFYFPNTEVTDYYAAESSTRDSAGGEFSLITMGHAPLSRHAPLQIQTQKLIFCTNAFAPKNIVNIKPGRGQVLITKPIPKLNIKGTFHFDQGYYYYRNVGDRILFGGGRNIDFKSETTIEFELNQKIQADLIQKLKEIILPNTPFEIDMQWSGIMAFSDTKQPIISKISENIIYTMNCNGMGVCLSPITAKEVVNII